MHSVLFGFDGKAPGEKVGSPVSRDHLSAVGQDPRSQLAGLPLVAHLSIVANKVALAHLADIRTVRSHDRLRVVREGATGRQFKRAPNKDNKRARQLRE